MKNESEKIKRQEDEETIIELKNDEAIERTQDNRNSIGSSLNNSDGRSLSAIAKNDSKKNYIGIVLLVTVFFFGGLFLGGKSSKNNSSSNGISSLISSASNPKNIFSNTDEGKPDDLDFSVFWEAWNQMDNRFVDVEDLDPQKMVYGAIRGMVAAVGDPYSAYMDPDETKDFDTQMEGSFEGIGAELGMKDGMLTVVSPLEGMPAEAAGLRAGDVIAKIYEESTLDMTIDDAVKRIRGEKGTEVKLTIAREETKETLEIVITRGTIDLKSVTYEKKENGVGYIRVSSFLVNTDDEFNKAVVTAINDNAKGLIIDLRNNPGGYLDVAVNMVSTFVPGGEVVVWEKGRGDEQNPSKESPIRALRIGEKLLDIPVVVLMNGGSASASEIMAGALRDIKGTKLIGEKSFGKGSVQQVQSLRDDSSMKITIAKWLTPNKDSIHEVGLEPDIDVELTIDDYEAKRDPQLDRAIEELRKEIK